MPWKRPSDLPCPTVWGKFEGRKPIGDGKIPKFKVQDVPENLREDFVDFMMEHFVRDEPTCRSKDLINCHASISKLRKLYEKCILDNVALLCLIDECLEPGVKPTIVGANITTISRRSDKDEEFTPDTHAYNVIIGAVSVLIDTADIFKRYPVDEYMAAYGLIVHPKYRGQNIGTEILKARVPLCKAIGIKITGTVFTNINSQNSAAKAGYQTIAEISYDDLKKKHSYTFPNMNEISSKFMVLEIK